MATVMKCVDCPERSFDSAGSARGHANRLGHQLVEIDEALAGESTSLEDIAEDVAPETEETALAKYPALTGELGEELEALADSIRANYEIGANAVRLEWQAYRAIAEALAKARVLLRGDNEYGRWVKEQNFPFATTRTKELRMIGERIDAAQEYVDTSVEETGQVPGLRKIKAAIYPKVTDLDEEADDDEDEGEVDVTPRKTALELIQGFLYGSAAEAFASASLEDEDYWNAVPADDRNALAKEFERLNRRMQTIVEIWRQ